MYATLSWIHDFSPSVRGQGYPNRLSVQDLIVNAGCLVKQVGTMGRDFSEGDLLMFHASVGSPDPRVHRVTV